MPLAALVVLTPFTIDAFTARAGADTASDCTAAFTTSPATQLSFTTDPPVRYATIGQTVSLSAGWDPAAWDSVTSAVACVQVNDAVNDVLGGSEAAPADSGAFTHSFTIPADVPAGSVLCARIRLAGDPAGPETEAVWVSNTHCFEVDTETTDTTAPEATPPVQPQIPPAGESSTTTTAPATSGSDVSAPPSSTPAAETGTPDTGIFSPEGGGSPPGTPVDEAATPPEAAKSSAPRPAVPMLPATGIAARTAIHAGDALFFFGLAFVVLFGRPRRRRRSAS
ncbi:MAG TPA: hypothetical protein VGO87_04155 [Acidimicrobiia bacterium]